MPRLSKNVILAALFLGGVAIVSCNISINPGGDGMDPSITFTIANKTFTLTLGTVGTFDAQPDTRVSNIADLRQQLFERTPTDTPESGMIRLRSSMVEVLEPSNGKIAVTQQAIDGAATLTFIIDQPGAASPCETGIAIGSMTLAVAGGVVTSADQTLDLTPAALALVIANDFSLCLQIEANFAGRVVIVEIEFVFGPAVEEGNVNGNDNTDPLECVTDEDCAPGLVCVAGLCQSSDDGNTNDNSNDNMDDNSNDNVVDNGNTNDNVTPPPAGFTEAAIRHRGSEQLVAGPNVDSAQSLQTPAGYGVIDIALSGDGQKVWFVLYDEFPIVTGDPLQQLWSVNTDGTGGLRSAMSDADIRGLLGVATNEDGSVAIFESGFSSSAFLRASPGSAATLLFDATVINLGGCARATMRLTDSGDRFYYRDYCNQIFYSVDLGASNPAPTRIAAVNEIVNAGGLAARGINEFDIDATGGQWLLYAEVLDAAMGNLLRFYLVPETGIGSPAQFEPLPDETLAIRNLHLSDDGSLIAYCQTPATFGDVGNCYVQQAGTSNRTVITDDRTALGDMAFSDDGSRIYVNNAFQFDGTCSYLQNVATGEKISGGSTRFADGACPDYDLPQLSEDGTILAAGVARGVYVLHDGVDGLLGFPTIEHIYYRYDGDESLVVRVEVADPAVNLERIYVMPFYSTGLDPTATIAESENPFFNDRSGGGVNLSTTFTEVAGSPGVWERTLSLCNSGVCKRSFITEEYRLRIIVVDATGTRTVFQDFTPY